MTGDLGADAGDCPVPRCKGRLAIEAAGVNDASLPVVFAVCGTCGQIVERDAPPLEGQEALPW